MLAVLPQSSPEPAGHAEGLLSTRVKRVTVTSDHNMAPGCLQHHACADPGEVQTPVTVYSQSVTQQQLLLPSHGVQQTRARIRRARILQPFTALHRYVSHTACRSIHIFQALRFWAPYTCMYLYVQHVHCNTHVCSCNCRLRFHSHGSGIPAPRTLPSAGQPLSWVVPPM